MNILFKKILRIVLVIYVFSFAYLAAQPEKELLTQPPRTSVVADQDVHFLADETFVSASGTRVSNQVIWDRVYTLISNAEHVVFLDMFLYNDFSGAARSTSSRPLSRELTEVLLEKRVQSPLLPITLVTDPINTVYGGATSSYFSRLQSSGILVVETDLEQLRDSNLLWSAFWRPFISWTGNTASGGLFPHPFASDGQKVSLRSWLELLNFKANHRKLLIADAQVKPSKNAKATTTVVTLVSSANPHDGSSAHGNVALQIDRAIWQDALENERVVVNLSGGGLPVMGHDFVEPEATGSIKVSLLRDEAIREKALSFIAETQKGDAIDIEMFYLSEREVVDALTDASARGVRVRLILDPNKDAFGHEKNGIPNRPVAKELVSRSRGDIAVRWCDTHGEQCHAKLLMGKTATSSFMLVGSANFTRRNIGGYNLEASVSAESDVPFTAWKDAQSHFDRLWSNEGGGYTTDYEVYQDETIWKGSLYRMMEMSGLSSF